MFNRYTTYRAQCRGGRGSLPGTALRALLPVLFLLACSQPQLSHAHAPGQSYVFLEIHEQQVTGRVEMTIADLNRALALDLATDGTLALEDARAHADAIAAYLRQRIQVFPDGEAAALQFDWLELLENIQTQYLAYHFSLPGDQGLPQYIDFDYTVLFDEIPEHRGFLVVENDWKTGTFNNEAVISSIFAPGSTTGRLDLTASTFSHGFWEMTKLGMHHIWIGIDHILFLLALLLPSVVRREEGQWQASRSFKASFIYVLKIVTLFTIAHTITLSAGTLGSIAISPRIVESVIALSIAVAALDLLWPIFRGHIWWVVFLFGLFHGLGFASVLADIGVPAGYMVYSLLAFNIGVELGQLAIVAVAFPVLYLIRQGWFYQRFFLPAGATALIVVSMYWFLERGFLLDLPGGEYANWALGLVGASG